MTIGRTVRGLLDRFGRHMQEVVRGSSVAFVLRAAGAALALGFNVFLTRLVGPRGAGIYFLSLTVVTIGTVVGRLGMDNALLRMIAAAKARDDAGRIRGIYLTGMRTAFTVAIGAALLTAILAPLLARFAFKEPHLTHPLWVMAIAIPAMTVGLLHGEVLKGLGHIGESQFIQWGSLHFFNIVMLYPLVRWLGITGATASYALAAWLTVLLGRVLWLRAAPDRHVEPAPTSRREILASSTPLFWIASLNMVMNWIGLLLLGALGSSAEVGVFGVAARMSVTIGFVLVAVNAVAAPKFAALHVEGKRREMSLLASQSSRLMVMLAAPLLLVFVVAAGPVMSLFGPAFRTGASALAIMATGQFLVVCGGSAIPVLMMTGYEKAVRNLLGAGVLVAVVLCVALVPPLGLIGAAIATSSGLVAMNGGAVAVAWKECRCLTLPLRPSLVDLDA